MTNETYIPTNLVADIQEMGNSVHLLEQVQDKENTKEFLELLSHFEDSLETALEEIQNLKEFNRPAIQAGQEELFYECA